MPKVSPENQVTIPAKVPREAGLEPGDVVLVHAKGPGRLEVERASDVIDRLAGSMPPGTYPPGYLDDLRDEWDRSSSMREDAKPSC